MSVLYAEEASGARGWAIGLSWFWRLGSVAAEPGSEMIGVGLASEAGELRRLIESGRLAGGVVLQRGEAETAAVSTVQRSGVARFEGGTRTAGEYAVFPGASAEAVVSSSLGTHAARLGQVLHLAYEPEHDWGRLDSFWALEAVHAFIAEVTGMAPRALPPIGTLRLDDTPGIALHQLQGRAKPDWRQAPRLARTARRLARASAVLNVAVAAEALDGDRRVPLESVWPRSVKALRAGVEDGAYEPVCHGLLHLDTAALEAGEIEFREFARLDAEEAGRRLDRALEWQRHHLGDPRSFVAPAWAYGPAADAEAAARGLTRWHRPRPGPMLEAGRIYETLIGALPGIHALDYSPLQRLARIGIPPTIAMHGAMLDSRTENLRPSRNPLSLARLIVKRDVTRLIRLEGIKWVGVGEFGAELERFAGSPEGRGSG